MYISVPHPPPLAPVIVILYIFPISAEVYDCISFKGDIDIADENDFVVSNCSVRFNLPTPFNDLYVLPVQFDIVSFLLKILPKNFVLSILLPKLKVNCAVRFVLGPLVLITLLL